MVDAIYYLIWHVVRRRFHYPKYDDLGYCVRCD